MFLLRARTTMLQTVHGRTFEGDIFCADPCVWGSLGKICPGVPGRICQGCHARLGQTQLELSGKLEPKRKSKPSAFLWSGYPPPYFNTIFHCIFQASWAHQYSVMVGLSSHDFSFPVKVPVSCIPLVRLGYCLGGWPGAQTLEGIWFHQELCQMKGRHCSQKSNNH